MLFWLTVNFLPVAAFCPLGGLYRNQDHCPARTYDEEYHCLIQQNSLRTIMDCAGIDPATREDNVLCRELDDGIPNNGNDNYYQDLPPSTEKFCMSPRNVLLAGSQYPNCLVCGMRGILQACPYNDPHFHNCLCENNVNDFHLECLSRCFMRSSESLSCPRRRREDHEIAGEVEPYPAAGMAKLRRSLQGSGAEYIIDDFGQPVYETTLIDGFGQPYIATATGLQLPYRERLLGDGSWLQRCYVDPWEPYLHCQTYSLTATYNLPSETGAADHAIYISTYEEDMTHSAPPKSTSAPRRSVGTADVVKPTRPHAVQTSTITGDSAGYHILPDSLAFVTVLASIILLI